MLEKKRKIMYSSVSGLQVSPDLLTFVNNEVLPGTGIQPSRFWDGFSKIIHDMGPVNIALLAVRELAQQGRGTGSC